MSLVFRVRKWLEDDEFKELLRIADYNGFQEGSKVFTLNIEKALRNKYYPVDVKNLILEYADEPSLSTPELEEVFKPYNPVVEWYTPRGTLRFTMHREVYSSLRDKLRRYQYRYIGQVDDKITIEVAPFHGHDVYKVFSDHGFSLVDPNNLFTDKSLAWKVELRNIELRPYQKEALDKWVENNHRGIIALPTGSGKTIIAIAALAKVAARTLIVAYTREQLQQWRDFILKTTNIPAHMVGLFYGEEKRLAPITITTYQSGFRNINMLSPHFALLIVDEVHHLPADKFKHIALHSLAYYRMGLSATPVREDGRHEELFPLLGGIVYYKTPPELVEQGYLARYNIITVKVKLKQDERKLYEQLRARYRLLVGARRFEEVLEAAKRGDPRAIEALRIHSDMRQIIALSQSKIDKAVEIAKQEYENGSKVIVFTQYIDQAEEIAKRLGALLLTGETPDQDRKRALEQFKKSPRGILVVTTVGDEGLDIPDANVGIIVSGTGSRRQFIQRLGRLLRPKSNKTEARLYEIVIERTAEEIQARKRKTIDQDDLLQGLDENHS